MHQINVQIVANKSTKNIVVDDVAEKYKTEFHHRIIGSKLRSNAVALLCDTLVPPRLWTVLEVIENVIRVLLTLCAVVATTTRS